MADNNVKITISAVDKASQTIQKTNSNLSKMTGVVTAVSTAFTAFYPMLENAAKEISKIVTETVAYNKQIREMTQVTGLGAKEISRIVQVADDWGIEIGEVRNALAIMNKNGVTPSIDNLAKLADEYINTADKSAFAEKAAKLLGKNYQVLIPILAQGGRALKEQAEAISENMLATEGSMRAAREYEVAMDDLGDAFQGVKYELGNQLLPTLIKVVNALNDLISANVDTTDAAERLREAHAKGVITDKEMAVALRALRTGQGDYTAALKKATNAEETSNRIEEDSNRLDNVRANRLIPDVTDAVEEETEAIVGLSLAMEEQKAIAEKVNYEMDTLHLIINGKLGPSQDDFIAQQDELKTKMAEVEAAIDLAIKQGYSRWGNKVQDLMGDYRDLYDQYGKNEKEHDRATKEIMFDILEQRAAVGGLTAEEVIFLQSVATAWGMTDTATLTYMTDADKALTWLAEHPGDTANAIAILTGQTTAWALLAIEAERALSAAANYAGMVGNIQPIQYGAEGPDTNPYPVGGGDLGNQQYGGKQQHGLDMIVPPGFPNDSFPLGRLGYAESGERVIVVPKNVTNNFTYNSHTNSSSSTLLRDFNMMKATAG